MNHETYSIALAGNPNVGKSTIFNCLTGMHQHTGNWSGKTVDMAQGHYVYNNRTYEITDLPGTYSLFYGSKEEQIARDLICFKEYDCIVIVADGVCLERNLNLVLQISELAEKAVLCVNLMDEAEKKGIKIDLTKLSKAIGMPVISTSARNKSGLEELKKITEEMCLLKAPLNSALTSKKDNSSEKDRLLSKDSLLRKDNLLYKDSLLCKDGLKSYIPELSDFFESKGFPENLSRWAASKFPESDTELNDSILNYMNLSENDRLKVHQITKRIIKNLKEKGITTADYTDESINRILVRASRIYEECVTLTHSDYDHIDRKLDRLFTSKLTGYPIMLLILLGIFWITIVGANYPSAMLSDMFDSLKIPLTELLESFNASLTLEGILIDGVYTTLTWVISVMLPPMAIFFPLFTLLEDSGYLPRVAFNLDKYFKKSCAHGKQSITMCMGFGCNACGVTGCRIIDSPRERLIAVITNTFVPCNGRFPGLIALITIFFAEKNADGASSFKAAVILCLLILFGIFVTLTVSKFLSKTVLKGIPSSFVLELPPYRKPQFAQVIIRSVFDRTVFVLGRAVVVAAPAGALIWAAANITVGDSSVLNHITEFLDPFAALIGLDGVILTAFILGWPANEIVIPIIIMTYMATGTLADYGSLDELRYLFTDNGWTVSTALCTMLFSIVHFPCATTSLTVYKETKSLKWTGAALIIPTAAGIAVCFAANTILSFIL